MELVILASAGGGYLAVTFVASALFVRFWPATRLARRLRLDLAVFALLPVLLVLAAAISLGRGVGGTFEILSRRPRYKRYRYGSSAYRPARARRAR